MILSHEVVKVKSRDYPILDHEVVGIKSRDYPYGFEPQGG